jgi:hypothetical protein
MTPFSHVEVEHPHQLFLLSQHLELFAFRGQADAEWELVTSLERAFLKSGLWVYAIENTEYWMIHDFCSKYHLYSKQEPRVTNKFEWMALMQHHGGATRLLDFTNSLYVAAYFSVINSSTDSAIWAINQPLLRDNLYKTGRLSYKPMHDLKDVVNANHIELFNAFVARQNSGEKKDNLLHLIPLESQSLFDRASKQQSLFIAAGCIEGSRGRISYMDNLFSSFDGFREAYSSPEHIDIQKLCPRVYGNPNYEQYAVIKIILPRRIHKQLKKEFSHMGLSEETLFPGLDGLSREIVARRVG